MTDSALLIGNGLNLLSKNGPSWSDVINDLAGKPSTQHEEDVRKLKPFTLWFEELISSRDLGLTKEHVCQKLSGTLKPNQFHKRVLDLGAKNILTTNYDYSLELASSEVLSADERPPERDFSLFRRNVVNGTRIWHLHGEIGHPRSIMLGHGHYSRYVTKICNYLAKGVSTEIKARNKVPFVSKFSKSYKGKKVKQYEDSWVDQFLGSDVHVIGFGFDYTENDIWHLLTVKRDLSKRGLKVGRTIFHRCSPKLPSNDDEARYSLLKSFNVEIQLHTESDYDASYDACLTSLKSKIQ